MWENLAEKIEEVLSMKKLSWSDIESTVVRIQEQDKPDELFQVDRAKEFFSSFIHFRHEYFVNDTGKRDKFISLNIYTPNWIFFSAQADTNIGQSEGYEPKEYISAVPRNPNLEVMPSTPGTYKEYSQHGN